ncbi:MAG TPA: M14 metallopeptidase family protein [Terriglobia bacterium]|nr:M14 metallopeptidase family protein [Terriglobia bacterium]
MLKRSTLNISRLLLIVVCVVATQAQTRITTPKEQFGFNIGDDYVLVNYTQYVDYLKKLSRESDRLTLEEIGKSSEGRTMHLAIITSPENGKKLARYKEIAEKLAHAEGLAEDEARALAAEGKAVVWINGGIHANEVLGAQQLIENIYQLVSRTDSETVRFLNDVIILNCLVNPDGMELVSDWYMQEREPTRRSTGRIPRLYNKYAGHDDNRDFYMTALAETEAINKVLFRDWFPQIVYDHHQTGPAGAVMFSPPFRDPFNYYLDPLVVTLLDEVGSAMHSRFAMEGKPGVTSRSGANYSTWWNGGLRTSPYFHNQIGLLTETIGNPTPVDIPFVADKVLAKSDLPFPVNPERKWHFRQSIEYSITANRAVIDYASRNKDRLLFDIYRMGLNSIERGSRDTWTTTPRRIQGVKKFEDLRDSALRDPRGYIIPANQTDFLTATKFVNALIKNGVTVQRAQSGFTVNGKNYPAGSYVVKTAQAFRPQVLDMFEPQDHPDDFAYPGAPPTPPYDIAGWTLAFQMGVQFDRVLDGFDGPFEKLLGEVKPAAGKITELSNPMGYVLGHEMNDSFIAVNRLLGSKEDVYWMKNAFTANGKTYPPGSQFIPAKSGTRAKLEKLVQEIGLSFDAVATKPSGEAFMLRQPRVALWDRYGGSVPSGWTRYVLDKFEFPYSVIYQDDFTQNDLARKFDVLILVDDAVTNPVAPLRGFLQDGGTILAIGNSTRVASQLELAFINAVAELTRSEFYVPGSLLQARVDNRSPLAYGMPDHADFFYDNSPAFRVNPSDKDMKVVAWYDSSTPLRSGWAWGQKYLDKSAAVVEATVGKGKLLLFGPEILFRSQPHGTYKFLFNGIYYGRAETVSFN